MFSLPTADKNIGMTPNARIDALTSLPNLHSLFLQLDAELARSKRTDTALALVVVALEGFTQFTERFGRPEGGRLLKLVAIGLQQNFREYDCVARMAGAEFVLVLSGLKPQDLPEKLKRVEAVTRRAVAAVSGEKFIVLSMGAAFYPDDGADAESLLAEAGRRLYQAQQLRAATVRER